MMNNWFIDPFKGPYTLKKKGINLFGVVLFVVLFSLSGCLSARRSKYMENGSSPERFKRSNIQKLVAGLIFGLIVYAILFFLEYTHSTKQGDLPGSLFNALLLPIGILGCLWNFSQHDTELPAVKPWYSQLHILKGLLSLSFTLIFLLLALNSLLYNKLPDYVGTILLGGSLLLLLFAVIRMYMTKNPFE